MSSKNIDINNSEFISNTSKDFGGAGILLSGVEGLKISDFLVKGNIGKNGSGILANKISDATISDGEFLENRSIYPGNGASLLISFANDLLVTRIFCKGNIAGLGPSIIVTASQKPVVRDSRFINNTGTAGGVAMS